jgi:adenine phosphoribosyltransferase
MKHPSAIETALRCVTQYRRSVSHDVAISNGRNVVFEHLRWLDGVADTWSMLRSAEGLAAIVAGLAALVQSERPEVIIGIESRGFILAPAVALALGVGFAPVRKDGALFPGRLVTQTTEQDYRGNQRTLATRRDFLAPGQRVALIDDWIETGSQAIATKKLVEECGAQLVAVAVIIDEAGPTASKELQPILGLVRSSEL